MNSRTKAPATVDVMGQEQTRKIVVEGGYEGEVVEDRYNGLIGRREVKVVLYHSDKGTPMRYSVREALAKTYGTDLDRVYVRRIISERGLSRTIVEAHIYDSKDRALKFEPKHIIERNKGFEE